MSYSCKVGETVTRWEFYPLVFTCISICELQNVATFEGELVVRFSVSCFDSYRVMITDSTPKQLSDTPVPHLSVHIAPETPSETDAQQEIEMVPMITPENSEEQLGTTHDVQSRGTEHSAPHLALHVLFWRFLYFGMNAFGGPVAQVSGM